MAFIDDVELDERVNQRLARLAQYEPAGYVDGPDLYEFVMDDPVDHVDPLGLAAETIQLFGRVSYMPDVPLLGPDMTINPQFIEDYVNSQQWGDSNHFDAQGNPFTEFENLVDPFASPEQQARIDQFNQSALAHEAQVRDLLKNNGCSTMTRREREALAQRLFNSRTQFEREAKKDMLTQLLQIVENSGYDGWEDAAFVIQQKLNQLNS